MCICSGKLALYHLLQMSMSPNKLIFDLCGYGSWKEREDFLSRVRREGSGLCCGECRFGVGEGQSVGIRGNVD